MSAVGRVQAQELFDPVETTSDQAANWFAARIRAARAGVPELVRVPLTALGDRPGYAIGSGADGAGIRFVAPVSSGEIDLPDSGEVMVAEGYYVILPDARAVHQFLLLRTRRARRDSDYQLRVLMSGEEWAEPVPSIVDDRRYLVITNSIDWNDPNGAEEAAERVGTLHAAGFIEAETFDSRRAANLFCCYHTVVAGRLATRDQATALEVRADAAGFEAYVKEGWNAASGSETGSTETLTGPPNEPPLENRGIPEEPVRVSPTPPAGDLIAGRAPSQNSEAPCPIHFCPPGHSCECWQDVHGRLVRSVTHSPDTRDMNEVFIRDHDGRPVSSEAFDASGNPIGFTIVNYDEAGRLASTMAFMNFGSYVMRIERRMAYGNHDRLIRRDMYVVQGPLVGYEILGDEEWQGTCAYSLPCEMQETSWIPECVEEPLCTGPMYDILK